MPRVLLWLLLACTQLGFAAEYRLIQTTSLFSFVTQANELASAGYRLSVWNTGLTYCALFERLPADHTDRYDYAALPGTVKAQKRLKENLNHLGHEGFRVLPHSFTTLSAILLERRRGETQQFDYELGHTGSDTWPTKKQFDEKGFQLVALFRPVKMQGDSDNDLAAHWIWERSQGTVPSMGLTMLQGNADSPSKKPGRLQKKVDKLTASGYRFIKGGGPMPKSWHLELWFEPARNSPPSRYRVFRQEDRTKLAAALSEAGESGFRLVDGGATEYGDVIVEQKPGDSRAYSYGYLYGTDLADLVVRVNEAAASGARPRMMLGSSNWEGVIVETVKESGR